MELKIEVVRRGADEVVFNIYEDGRIAGTTIIMSEEGFKTFWKRLSGEYLVLHDDWTVRLVEKV